MNPQQSDMTKHLEVLRGAAADLLPLLKWPYPSPDPISAALAYFAAHPNVYVLTTLEAKLINDLRNANAALRNEEGAKQP